MKKYKIIVLDLVVSTVEVSLNSLSKKGWILHTAQIHEKDKSITLILISK